MSNVLYPSLVHVQIFLQAIRCKVLRTVLHISGQWLKGENVLWSPLVLPWMPEVF